MIREIPPNDILKIPDFLIDNWRYKRQKVPLSLGQKTRIRIACISVKSSERVTENHLNAFSLFNYS